MHVSKTQYAYQERNTHIENIINISIAQYTYRKYNKDIENTFHYQKDNTHIENSIETSKTLYTYLKHNTLIENTIHISNYHPIAITSLISKPMETKLSKFGRLLLNPTMRAK